MAEDSNILPMIETLSLLPKVSSKLELVKLYFERILPEYTLNVNLWSLYLQTTLDLSKDPAERLSVHIRALKNLYSSSDIWCSYALEQEK
jgi:hypothetical protein